MQKLVFFRALPTPSMARVFLDDGGRLVVDFPNSIVLSRPFERSLGAEVQTLWFDPARPPAAGPAHDVINHCADPDTYGFAMDWLDKAARQAGVRVFNHPGEVAKTRRDLISSHLALVPGLKVPRCVRFRAAHLNAFPAAFGTHGFRYPVIVRPAESQGGFGQLRIDSEKDWGRILGIDWVKRIFYMTEFVDFASADGRFVKLRVANIGPDAFVRHVKVGKGWQVHNATSDASEEELERHVQFFDADPVLKDILAEIRKRIRLDFWGLDIGYGSRSGYVLFEGNAAMTMAGRTQRGPGATGGPPTRRNMTMDILRQHMLSPSAWLSPGSP